MAISINFLYVFALTFTKISILCLYLRALNYPSVRLATKVLLGIVVASHLWIIISVCTTCIPLDAFWTPSKFATSYCHPFSVYWSHSGLNIATDLLIFALPLTVLHKIRVPPRQKIALYFVFILAFCVCIISILRTLQFIRGITLADERTIGIACWTMLEVNIAVICACLTTIKPLLAPLFPWIFSAPASPPRHGPEIETIGRANQRGGGGRPEDISVVTDNHELESRVAGYIRSDKEKSTTTESGLSTSGQSTSTA
ncbi:Rhodopsin domain-containing protein [Madurella fahalii]|uniref:Rhodopsin domain-containing protein n=1 Tax=Madurella fahalii TaxID=1157608 RepID=A0ABQ0GJ74_9PEZI